MRSSLANEMVRRQRSAQVSAAEGRVPSVLRLSASVAFRQQVWDRTKLPAVENDTPLQNAAGANIFVFGYSAFGGGDVFL